MSNELWIGLVAAVVASVLFGTIYVPVKKVDAGDGFSAQMFMCIGGFLASIFIHFLLSFPSIQGFAMIGGAVWGIANAVALQITKRLGMALSTLAWSTVSCITGWATSRYGLLGLPAAVPANVVLNYIGIFMLVAGKNKPWINPSGAVPAMLGGAIFAAALGAFAIALDNLDQAIAYPICAMTPGLVVLSWSILYFKEITGQRNLTWLASAYCFTLVGVILVAVSKEYSFC